MASSISRVEEVMLRNQLAILRKLQAPTFNEVQEAVSDIRFRIGYTEAFLQDHPVE